jgi:1,4-alpha-glucan branching enzyme
VTAKQTSYLPTTSPCGYLSLVLHAHLPYTRHPDAEDCLEEGWLFEAITETYIPLLCVLEGLVEDDIDFRLTMSLTPTLVSMLQDKLLIRRYSAHLDRLCELSESEVVRTRHLPFHPVALMYRARFSVERAHYRKRWNRDLIGAFARLQELGKVELLASAATHGFLPLLRINPSAVRAQIFAGVQHYVETFGQSPRGIWLPECGYYVGLERILEEAGIRYFFVDSHALLNASCRPQSGTYAPLCCAGGTAAFGRDEESSKQVWSSIEGYPGDFDYREFYRDIGHDLDFDYIKPYIHNEGIRIDTGIKYFRITGRTEKKEPYDRELAVERAARHAGDFVLKRTRQLQRMKRELDRDPIVVAPYDAELFGHWWFEGPDWLNFVFRGIACGENGIRLATPSEYLRENPLQQAGVPSTSSWGHEGYNKMWLNDSNDWIYRHLHEAADRMVDLALSYPKSRGKARRALNQAARELLLAQASDWAFIMTRKTVVDYAVRRTKTHLVRFHRLHEMIKNRSVDEGWLTRIEFEDNIFPGLQYEIYRPDYVFRSWKESPCSVS